MHVTSAAVFEHVGSPVVVASGETAAPFACAPKYRSTSTIDAMRQAAWAPWMHYFAWPNDLDEAFGFAPAEAGEAYYSTLVALVTETVAAFADERGVPVSALDVGAGVGRVAIEVARTVHVNQVFALEHSPELVHEMASIASGATRQVSVPVTAAKNLRAIIRPPGPAPKLSILQGDAHKLPFEEASFACVWAFGLLDRVARPSAVVAELARVLEPGGIALVSCLHDFPGGPADTSEWLGTAGEAFDGSPWASATAVRRRLDLRQNAHFMESFNAEILTARRSARARWAG